MGNLLEADVEGIVSENKFITEPILWVKTGNEEYRVVVPVESRIVTTLHIFGRRSRGTSCLILQDGTKRAQILRKWDNEPSHRNPGEKVPLGKPHKHTYTDRYGNDWAYIPPIEIDPKDINKALLGFLEECNIEVTGHVGACPPLVVQRSLSPTLKHLGDIDAEEVDPDEDEDV